MFDRLTELIIVLSSLCLVNRLNAANHYISCSYSLEDAKAKNDLLRSIGYLIEKEHPQSFHIVDIGFEFQEYGVYNLGEETSQSQVIVNNFQKTPQLEYELKGTIKKIHYDQEDKKIIITFDSEKPNKIIKNMQQSNNTSENLGDLHSTQDAKLTNNAANIEHRLIHLNLNRDNEHSEPSSVSICNVCLQNFDKNDTSNKTKNPNQTIFNQDSQDDDSITVETNREQEEVFDNSNYIFNINESNEDTEQLSVRQNLDQASKQAKIRHSDQFFKSNNNTNFYEKDDDNNVKRHDLGSSNNRIPFGLLVIVIVR